MTALIPYQEQQEIEQESSKAKRVKDMLLGIDIRTSEHIAQVTPLLQHIKGDLKRLVEQKERITKPLNDALRNVRDLFRPAEDTLKECETILKQRIGTAQQAINEANRKAQLATQAALAAHDVRAAALASGSIQSTEAPQGLGIRQVWVGRVVDASKLPREFLMPDERRIREHVAKFGQANPIPGVLVEADTRISVRAR